jgi:2-amino-4-hydroxy-6-hydroxymethyldihydropteridine diphosphokinase
MSTTVYLSLGSNLGDREQNLIKACDMLSYIEGLEIIAHSPLYISDAVEMGDNAPDFMNMVVKGEFIYRPQELLNNIEDIETRLGRTDKGKHLPRTIDIDILLFGNEVISTEALTIPHKKLTERAFALVPLLEIDPELTHPANGKKLSSFVNKNDARELVMYKEFARHNA